MGDRYEHEAWCRELARFLSFDLYIHRRSTFRFRDVLAVKVYDPEAKARFPRVAGLAYQDGRSTGYVRLWRSVVLLLLHRQRRDQRLEEIKQNLRATQPQVTMKARSSLNERTIMKCDYCGRDVPETNHIRVTRTVVDDGPNQGSGNTTEQVYCAEDCKADEAIRYYVNQVYNRSNPALVGLTGRRD